jgi:hypothetical protein
MLCFDAMGASYQEEAARGLFGRDKPSIRGAPYEELGGMTSVLDDAPCPVRRQESLVPLKSGTVGGNEIDPPQAAERCTIAPLPIESNGLRGDNQLLRDLERSRENDDATVFMGLPGIAAQQHLSDSLCVWAELRQPELTAHRHATAPQKGHLPELELLVLESLYYEKLLRLGEFKSRISLEYLSCVIIQLPETISIALLAEQRFIDALPTLHWTGARHRGMDVEEVADVVNILIQKLREGMRVNESAKLRAKCTGAWFSHRSLMIAPGT